MNLKALHIISYGLYVIASIRGDSINGQIANTLLQITSEPPTVAVVINKNNLTHEFIQESRVFSASILSRETPLSFIGRFGFRSGRDMDKFNGIGYKVVETRAPVVTNNTLAYLEVTVTRNIDVGTHSIFIGDLVAADILQQGEPMTYTYYQQVKRGTTPESAPSYIKQ